LQDRKRAGIWVEEFSLLSQEHLLGLAPSVDYVVTTAIYSLEAAFISDHGTSTR
jgi:hypothetical protein